MKYSQLSNQLSIICLIGVMSVVTVAKAASFDCAKAKTGVEKLVCGHADLSKLDDKLQDAYHEQFVQANDKRIVRALQRYWLKHVRNICKTVQCVSFAYKERILALQHYPVYFFTLTQGKGTPVCEAYLKRLNTADFAKPPYCNIPETTHVPGFTVLHRVTLNVKQIAILGPHISTFNRTGQQGTKQEIAKFFADNGISSKDQLQNVKKMLQRGWKFWRYNPQVDINNDGKSDNVVLQHEGGCGHPIETQHFQTDGRKPTLAYVLIANNDRLDIPKTKAIFGHPGGGYLSSSEFRPIGPTIGIFKYKQLYYIDTYLYDYPINDWGLLTHSKYKPEQANTLAVFLRQHGKTKRMCEYHMTQTE